jgi:biotin operon repressor
MEDEIFRGFVKETREWEMQVFLAKQQIGIQKKVAQGRWETFRKGIQTALQEGRQESAKQLARELERQGVSAEEIAGDTGLTLEQASELLPKITFTKGELQAREEKHQIEMLDQVFHAKLEGLRTGVKKIVQNLKDIGVPIDQITQATGLAEWQIRDL